MVAEIPLHGCSVNPVADNGESCRNNGESGCRQRRKRRKSKAVEQRALRVSKIRVKIQTKISGGEGKWLSRKQVGNDGVERDRGEQIMGRKRQRFQNDTQNKPQTPGKYVNVITEEANKRQVSPKRKQQKIPKMPGKRGQNVTVGLAIRSPKCHRYVGDGVKERKQGNVAVAKP